MNSQRGKASTKASGQNKSLKTRQAIKSQTNDGSRRPMKAQRRTRDLSNTMSGKGELKLGSSNSSRVRKSHIIEEDEYIGEVNGSVSFATTSYPVNIGQSTTFPWGYKIAALYEKYQFTYLEFYYRREVSEYATNGQAGKVMLSFDFDASDAPPSGKQQVLDTEPHVDGMPCMDRIGLVINPRELARQDSWYVRPGSQPLNTDIKTYDCGNLFVSTYGNANTTVVGELRVRYKCIVSIPVLSSAGGSSGGAGSYLQITSNLSGETAAATTVYGALFASATTPVVIGNGIGATFASSGLITLLAGSYLIEGSCASTDSAATVSSLTSRVCQVATASTDIVWNNFANGGGTSSVSSAQGYTGSFTSLTPFVWNTALWGTTLTYQVAATYASGTALNQAVLKITQL
jgi:hypothetical protein